MSTYNYIPNGVCKSTCVYIPSQALNVKNKPNFRKRINKARLVRKIDAKNLEYSRKLIYGTITTPPPIPASFSWRYKINTPSTYNLQIESPRDQGQCGCCWAFAVCQSLGDRYTIKYNTKGNYLSATWLINQTYTLMGNTPDNSCDRGGDPYLASTWLESNIIKLESCWPYNIISDNNWKPPNPFGPQYLNSCYNCDSSNEAPCAKYVYSAENSGIPNNFTTQNILVFNNDGSVDKGGTISAIQRDIMNNGPIITGFQTYPDFETYWQISAPSGGVYIWDQLPNAPGGHAVTITGWGVDSTTKIRYWEVRNSWGVYGGDAGYFKVAFSTDAPVNANLQIDIPQYQSPYWYGGTISILPGPDIGDIVYADISTSNIDYISIIIYGLLGLAFIRIIIFLLYL